MLHVIAAVAALAARAPGAAAQGAAPIHGAGSTVQAPTLATPPLSWIRAVEVLSGGRVRLRAPNVQIERLIHGGIYDDRHYIRSETGEVVAAPGARPADEIVLARGETCMLGGGHGFARVTFVGVERGMVALRIDGSDRAGRPIQGIVRVPASH